MEGILKIIERLLEDYLHNLLSLEPKELFKKYENFRVKNETLENKINNDIPEKAIELPDQEYEKFSANGLKEQKK